MASDPTDDGDNSRPNRDDGAPEPGNGARREREARDDTETREELNLELDRTYLLGRIDELDAKIGELAGKVDRLTSMLDPLTGLVVELLNEWRRRGER